MGIIHLHQIGDQQIAHLTVGIEFPVFLLLPGAKVHLINIHRPVVRCLVLAPPDVVAPAITADIRNNRSGGRPHLRLKCVRIRLQKACTISRYNPVFVKSSRLYSRKKTTPKS
ncbi:hypothetical protein D3C86_1612810 [compost metagenome]